MALKSNELRIGNLVKRNDMAGLFSIRSVCTDRIHPINLIEHDYEKNVHYGCECTLSELEPIKLEEDDLTRFGFEFDGEYYSHPSLSEKFLIYEGEKIDEYRLHFTHRKCVSLYYIHQLQNLYFALTGQELQYTPTK